MGEEESAALRCENIIQRMLGKYKRIIIRLTGLLRQIEADRENLDALIDLQERLVSLIRKTERDVAELRTTLAESKRLLRNSRPPKQVAIGLRKRIETLKERIDDHLYLKFIWKCFGDGIAFTYLDKFTLKHTFYDTTDYVPKQDAGALSGKAGLEREWAAVKKVREMNAPAMLCDITNILRHGDVCVLVGPDPIPIEVKSSKNVNKRVQRQLHNIESLMKFYREDEARDFRGVPHVRRVPHLADEVTHVDVINDCIKRAEGKAMATASPEAGLLYLCLHDASGLDEVKLTSGTVMCLLNEAKRERDWMPYFPFTLSIRDPQHLYEFIKGDLTLAVLVETSEIINQFVNSGVKAVLSLDENYVIWMRLNGGTATSAVSRQMFGRLYYEFESLSWFVAANGEHALKIDESLAEQVRLAEGGSPATEGWTAIVPEDVLCAFDELEPLPSSSSVVEDPSARKK